MVSWILLNARQVWQDESQYGKRLGSRKDNNHAVMEFASFLS
jgi:hypothetical protein